MWWRRAGGKALQLCSLFLAIMRLVVVVVVVVVIVLVMVGVVGGGGCESITTNMQMYK